MEQFLKKGYDLIVVSKHWTGDDKIHIARQRKSEFGRYKCGKMTLCGRKSLKVGYLRTTDDLCKICLKVARKNGLINEK